MNLSTVFQYLFLLSFAHAAERHASSSSSSSDEGSQPPSTGKEPPVLKIRAQKDRLTPKESSWMARAREAEEEIFRALQLLFNAMSNTESQMVKYKSEMNQHLSRAQTLVGAEKALALKEAADNKKVLNVLSKKHKDLDCALLLHDILASGYDMEISDNKIIKGLSQIALELQHDNQATTLKDWESELNLRDSEALQKARLAKGEIKQAMQLYYSKNKDDINRYLEAEKHLKAALETKNETDIKSAQTKMSEVAEFKPRVDNVNRFKTLLRMIDRTNNENEVLNEKDINKALHHCGAILQFEQQPTTLVDLKEKFEPKNEEILVKETAAVKILAEKDGPTSAESSWMKRAREARDDMELALPHLQRNIELYEKSLAKQERLYAAGLAKLAQTQGTAKVELLYEISKVMGIISYLSQYIADFKDALKLSKIVTSDSKDKLSDRFIIRGLSAIAEVLIATNIPTSLKNWEYDRLMRNWALTAKYKVLGYLEARKYYQELVNTNPSYEAKSTLEKIEIVLKMIEGTNSEHEVLSMEQIGELDDKIGTIYMDFGVPAPFISYHVYQTALKKAKDAELKKTQDNKNAQPTEDAEVFVPNTRWRSNEKRTR